MADENVTRTANGWEVCRRPDGAVGRAQFSADRTRRYALMRRWVHASDPMQVSNPNDKMALTWVMLNPSTAGAAEDDATIRKCVGYAKRWGYGGIRVLNLFDLIATDPAELGRHPQPCSEENERVWKYWLTPFVGGVWGTKPDVVVGWGDGALRTHWHPGYIAGERDKWAARMFVSVGVEPTCLGVTAKGQPLHPGRTPYDLERVPWKVL